MRAITTAVLGFVAFVLGPAQGCGDDAEKTCVETLCDPSAATICSGNDIRRCEGGVRYTYQSCGAQQRCDATSGAAACVPKQCTTPGLAICASAVRIETCREDGSGKDTEDCAAAEKCLDGQCVPSTCSEGGDVCSTNGYLRCAAGAWSTTACAPGETCRLKDGVASCGPAPCVGGTRRCDGNVARVCDARGTVETGTTCGQGEVCLAGRCQAEVCGIEEPDTSDADTTDTSETSNLPEPQITFKVGGQTFALDQSAYVEFDEGPRTLVLRASKSTRALRILFESSSSDLVGSFNDVDFNAVKVRVCYDDGGTPATLAHCPEGFTHESSKYEVTIAANPGPNEPGRVTGTFEATVLDQNRVPLEIVDGTFSLEFR